MQVKTELENLKVECEASKLDRRRDILAFDKEREQWREELKKQIITVEDQCNIEREELKKQIKVVEDQSKVSQR